ncbi:hypothetical protein TL16_g08367 [Triparma laevis f. inornata]|uniref:WW domain-containing protein n=1 Tax=Triparma laevis f. inornata TaxID=1714386 RepID=A0A9W7AXA6_9STRA|nr:hypothetical protein TL16_g08367 [Triparma laevis f. inornata]
MMNTIKVNQHIDAIVNNSTGIESIQRLEREYERGESSQSSMSNKLKKKKSGTPKKGFGIPPPSNYHIEIAQPKTSTPGKDPKLIKMNMPPALLPARQVNSSMEFKNTPSKSVAPTQSPISKLSSPPKIPGPAMAPTKNGLKGYEHQRKGPKEYERKPPPKIKIDSPIKPVYAKNVMTPSKGSITPSQETVSATTLGPKARGMGGRKLFKNERIELEDEGRRKEEWRKEMEREKEEKRLDEKKRDEERKINEIGSVVSSDDSDDEIGFSPDTSKINMGMNTQKRMLASGPKIRQYKKGFKPPPPPGRPVGKMEKLKVKRGAAPQPQMSERPNPDILTSHRSKNQKPEEMLNHGWYRFNDPETRWDYFWNEVTNESQYDRPVAFETVKDDIFASARNKIIEVGNDGWKRYVDEESKMQYFYKEETDEGQWERPVGFETIKRGGWTAEKLTGRRREGQLPVEEISESWVSYVDPNTGYKYYYNEQTQESTYDRPLGLETTVDPFASAREGGGKMVKAEIVNKKRDGKQLPVEKINGGWEKYVDPESGGAYYYYKEGDYSTYDRPEGFSTSANPFSTLRDDNTKTHNRILPAKVLTARRDQTQPAIEQLEGGEWEKHVDQETGSTYYWHNVSGESTYDRPRGYATTANPFASIRSNVSAVSSMWNEAVEVKPAAGVLSVRRDEETKPTEKLNGGWVKFFSEEYQCDYYYHESTDESSYDRPSSFATVQNPFSTARNEARSVPASALSSRREKEEEPVEIVAVSGGEKWRKFVDPESGHAYYYNESTDESTYERPLDYRTIADPFAAAREEGVMPPAEVLASARSEQKPVEKLRNKWFKYIDPSSQFPYYYNSETEESSYERPEGFQTNADPFVLAREQGVMPPAEVLASARSSRQKPDETINRGPWDKYTDPESGHPYYYNSETEESTYERPEGFQTTADPFVSARKSSRKVLPSASVVSARRPSNAVGTALNGGWTKYEDPESKSFYYYHEASDVSQWDRPDNFVTSNNPFGTVRSRRPRGSTLAAMKEGEQVTNLKEDANIMGTSNIMGTADGLDMMMATFNRGDMGRSKNHQQQTPSNIPSLGLGGNPGNNHGGKQQPRKSSIQSRAKTLISSNDVLSKVNDKLSNLSLSELEEMRDGGGGIMDTFSKKQQSSQKSSARSARDQNVPTIQNFNLALGQSSNGDSLDAITNSYQPTQSVKTEGSSWLETSDLAEIQTSSLAASSSLAETFATNEGGDDWQEYFDEEVGSKYFYNTVTGEASWVDPSLM